MDTTFKDPAAQQNLSGAAGDAIDVAGAYVETGRLEDAVNTILAVEKDCRNNADGVSGARVSVWLLRTLFEKGRWSEGREFISAICKKRSQLKRVQIDVVRCAMEWMDRMPTKEDTYGLLETLCRVTEAKIFLEVERARVVLKLAHMKEAEGNLESAANVVQEVQVESNIYMDKFEKAEYILEQMRLVVARSDWTRCQIVAKKLNPQTLEGAGFELIKLVYYGYMMLYHNSENNMKALSECFDASLNTDLERYFADEVPAAAPAAEQPAAAPAAVTKTSEDVAMTDVLPAAPAAEHLDFAEKVATMRRRLAPFVPAQLRWEGATADVVAQLRMWYLSALIVTLALSEESPEKVHSLRVILEKYEKLLRKMPAERAVVEQLTEDDVAGWDEASMAAILGHPLLAGDEVLPGAAERRRQLRIAFLHHDMVVVSKFYRRTTLAQLAHLVAADAELTEDELCTLIRKQNVAATINRPRGGIVTFNQAKEESTINQWTASVCQTLDALCNTCNSIEKELQRHQAASQA